MGLRMDGGGWIRPVSKEGEGELSWVHYSYPDGTAPKVLDVLDIDVSSADSKPHQPENWTIGANKWEFSHRGVSEKIFRLLQQNLYKGTDIFGDTSDRILHEDILKNPLTESVVLVKPNIFRWRIDISIWDGVEKRKTRAVFYLNNALYDLSVSDPYWRNRLDHLPSGSYSLPDSGLNENDEILLTISLTEPFGEEKYCYKLISAVIVLPLEWRGRL